MQQLGVYVCVALSAGFIVLDALGGGLNPKRPDLVIELFARVLMLVLAVLAARATRGDRNLRLLLWGVVCLSFDTYWQTTYRHVGGKPLEWLEMSVKYVGVGLGLGLLLLLCARFGDEAGSRLRAAIRRWALPFGAALTAVGLWHGMLYIRSCYFFFPGRDQCIISDQALFALDAYLVLDALLRATIVVAAVVGFVRASPDYKQRTLLVAFASVVFALGTVVDFTARLQLTYDAAAVLQIADAVTTVLFPLGLLYAATRRRLFDVEYMVKRSVSYTLASLIVVGLWVAAVALLDAALRQHAPAGASAALAIGVVFNRQLRGAARWTVAQVAAHRRETILFVSGLLIAVVELTLHQRVHDLAVAALAAVQHGKPEESPLLEYAVGVPFLFCWKPLADGIDRRVERFVSPERAKRRDRLRSVIAEIPFVATLAELKAVLHKALRTALFARFASIYLHDGEDCYQAYVWSPDREPEPRFLCETEPPVPRLTRRRHICLGCADKGIPDGELLLRMPVGGKTFGIFLCGPPRRAEVLHFAADEVAELEVFAATAGNALAAHGAKIALPIGKERS